MYCIWTLKLDTSPHALQWSQPWRTSFPQEHYKFQYEQLLTKLPATHVIYLSTQSKTNHQMCYSEADPEIQSSSKNTTHPNQNHYCQHPKCSICTGIYIRVSCLVDLQHTHHWDHIHKACIWKQIQIVHSIYLKFQELMKTSLTYLLSHTYILQITVLTIILASTQTARHINQFLT